ncbi:GNAT family N-acetyltransferase [Mammaliicoccus vitulinus]|uniref:GNAT family N-acetyltransferase n=1 Tax=Mammaliicoccus vitulinus TaxID=71237 RepID=UPI003F97F160
MDITLKNSSLNDSEIILNLQKQCFKDDYMLYKDDETSPYCENIDDIELGIIHNHHFTIVSQDKIVGVIEIKETKDRYHLYKLFVQEKLQGKGIGKNIVKKIFNILSKEKYWTVYTPHKNFKNHYFYESLGFKKYGEARVNEDLNLFKYIKQ